MRLISRNYFSIVSSQIAIGQAHRVIASSSMPKTRAKTQATKRKASQESDPPPKRGKKSEEKDDDAVALAKDKNPQSSAAVSAVASGSNGEQCWLFKSEPESRVENGVDVKFGIDDLAEEADQTACWDGVRNYQARNFMRDRMRVGELGFFYHSNCKVPGIAGIVRVVKEGYTDHTQFDRKDIHYDPKSKKDAPKWFMVDVQLVRKLKRFVPLSELKATFQKHSSSGGPLCKLALFCSARLSVQPVTKAEFDYIVQFSDTDAEQDE
eukprot:scpid68587/ scgid19606/ Thymocyte nuclear protein 1